MHRIPLVLMGSIEPTEYRLKTVPYGVSVYLNLIVAVQRWSHLGLCGHVHTSAAALLLLNLSGNVSPDLVFRAKGQ